MQTSYSKKYSKNDTTECLVLGIQSSNSFRTSEVQLDRLAGKTKQGAIALLRPRQTVPTFDLTFGQDLSGEMLVAFDMVRQQFREVILDVGTMSGQV
jgi:hypothetical protein